MKNIIPAGGIREALFKYGVHAPDYDKVLDWLHQNTKWFKIRIMEITEKNLEFTEPLNLDLDSLILDFELNEDAVEEYRLPTRHKTVKLFELNLKRSYTVKPEDIPFLLEFDF